MDFNNLLQQYGPLFSRVAASYEANHALCQELLQEILLAVWQAMPAFKGDSSEKTYVLKIAHNKAVSHVARQVRQLEETMEEDIAPAGPKLEEQLQRNEQQQRLLDAIRSLPIQSRQVLTLFMEGLSYEDIAEVCGLSLSNVGVIISRSRNQLAKELSHAG
ncbi:RNA polymerase sigma factor [Aliiglaciecola sp. CAU 1673]|uniref:RNA polymerase sigma factor n=1 Tax=Aliiglaciecola sp. CAU 1673 TaxID=3032595 RepID=UPI0023DC511B|nr:RNA polymerase sigma factor [Aliiglaciecola sp. CAU 1673]MDF2179678.1 RNA polymerase sigma factor [Aliiglaciecola sp. CAU 1673]